MRVAVVGAGVSGLTAIKCCRDEGLDVVCFEKRNDLGGLWNYTETVEPGQSNVTRSEIFTLLLLIVTGCDFRPFIRHAECDAVSVKTISGAISTNLPFQGV